jgi:transcriptional regulator with XRE-family HTH domain
MVLIIPIYGLMMLNSSQIRAARALLGWSGNELSKKSGVGVTTIRRYEMQDGIPDANTKVLNAIRTTFEAAGIEFTGNPLKNPGVTLNLGG